MKKFSPIAGRSATFATALVMLSAASAAAAPGVVNTTVNLRQGPGTNTPVIGKIPGGAPVNVAGCSGEWCQVTFAGKAGYVIGTVLRAGGPPPGAPPPGYAPPPPGYVVPPPYYGPYYYYYGYGPGPYWGWRGGWRGGWHGGSHGGWGRR
ncbi:MAG: SH3 domain-containing protein [Xanthobacteraceae bacterium]